MPIPGLVDLQVNGFNGVDFSGTDLTEEALVDAFRSILENGTTAFLPTLVTSPEAVYQRNLALIAKVGRLPEFQGHIPGIHIEGPFLSPEPGAVGAHNPAWIREPDTELFDRFIDWSEDTIRLLTVAAEREGADDLIRHAVRRGITVSLGHQMAREDDIARAVDAGATAVTHLGNGIPNMIHRHHNAIWAALGNDDLAVMLIADGFHLPPPVLKSMIRAKGAGRCVVVSDTAPLAGMPPGTYEYCGEEVVLENDGLLHNVRRNCLAGSTSSMIDCMNHLASLDFLDLDDLLRVGYQNPLRLIGVDPGEIAADRRIDYNREKRKFTLR